jgi:hypothetical protein
MPVQTDGDFHRHTSSKNQMVHNNEISLVDLWLLLRPYKKPFVMVSLSLFLLAVTYIYFFYDEIYSVVSTIQVGTQDDDNDETDSSLESPESLLSKINNSIIPAYTNKWLKESNYEGKLRTTATNPEHTNIILVTNSAREDEIDLISDYQKRLLIMVKDDNESLVKLLRSRLMSEQNLARLELEKLQHPLTLEHKLKLSQMEHYEKAIELRKLEDERYFGIQKAEFKREILMEQHELKRLNDVEDLFLKQFDRIEENKKILLENMNDLKAQITSAINNRRAASDGATEQSAMSLLLIDNEIQQNQNRLSDLEERYYIQLENKKAEISQKIESTRLKKEESRKQIAILKEKYERVLLENKYLRDKQELAVEEATMVIQQTKLEHDQSIKVQEETVRLIKDELDNINETRIVSTAVQSLEPTNMQRKQLLILAFVLAVFSGLFSMLMALFRDKVRERLEENALG